MDLKTKNQAKAAFDYCDKLSDLIIRLAEKINNIDLKDEVAEINKLKEEMRKEFDRTPRDSNPF